MRRFGLDPVNQVAVGGPDRGVAFDRLRVRTTCDRDDAVAGMRRLTVTSAL